MSKSISIFQRPVALTIGVGLTGLSAWFNWAHFFDVTAPVAAIVGALSWHAAETCWLERRRFRTVTFFLLSSLAMGISLVATLGRTVEQYDTKVHGKTNHNLVATQTGQALAAAEEAVKRAEAASKRECVRRTAECRKKEAEEKKARTDLEQTRNRVITAGVTVDTNPEAKRLAAILPVTEEQIALYLPLMLPIWLELASLAWLTFGLSPVRKPREKNSKEDRKIKRKVSRKVRQVLRKTATVVPFQKVAP